MKLKFSGYFISLIIIMCLPASAQLIFMRYDSIPVSENSLSLENAWAGGINSAMISQIDLNLDGLKDIFLFEKEGYIIRTFINDGTIYNYDPAYINAFPETMLFAFLADYNCDGYEDFFKYSPGGMAVYKNTSAQAGTLQFTLVTSLLTADYNPGIYNIHVSATDIPALADIDEDGDLDILAWTLNGNSVRYFKNLSMETFGNCDSLMFKREEDCWGKFLEGITKPVTFPASCKGQGYPEDEVRNCACPANLLALDMDGDHDKDLLLGRLTFRSMSLLINGGDSIAAAITAQDTAFPSNNTAVELIFSSGFYLDGDNDGIKDLLVSTSNTNGENNFESIWQYKNSGSDNFPVFSLIKKDFLQEDMIDLGSGANPAFFDYNSDGLMDMVVGNFGYFNTTTGTYESRLALFENSGTVSNPEYRLITRDYAGVSNELLMAAYPAFGDIDSDGDQDMIVGQYYGSLYLYENTAGAGNTANFVLKQADYKNIDIGWHPAPQLIDVNRDGLLDLLIGEKDGTINYFQNKGSASAAQFDSYPTVDTLGGIDVEIPCCGGYSTPFLFERFPGEYELLVGSERGMIYHFNSIDNNLFGNFSLVDSIYTGETKIGISMADINMDNKNELAVGAFTGGMHFLKSTFAVSNTKPVHSSPEIHIYPNPGNGVFTIKVLAHKKGGPMVLSIIDLIGREVYFKTLLFSGNETFFDISFLPPGFYFAKNSLEDQTILQKIIKHK